MRPMPFLATLTIPFWLTTSATAQSVHIDFDDLAADTVVTNQYPRATFSAEAGFQNVTRSDSDLGTSLPNYLCTRDANGNLVCTAETYVAFPVPVQNLRFFAAGDNDAGITARVDVYENGALSATVPVITNGDLWTPDRVDLTAFQDVTRIEIHDITDFGGLAWDDFQFDLCAGGVENYCSSSPNSVGAGSRISATGSTSIAANDFGLRTDGNPPHQTGLFYMGTQQTSTPFGNGRRCVSGTVTRYAVSPSDSAGIAVLAVDNTAPPALDRIVAGSVWNWQYWYRDPMAGGARFNLSDGLRAQYCP